MRTLLVFACALSGALPACNARMLVTGSVTDPDVAEQRPGPGASGACASEGKGALHLAEGQGLRPTGLVPSGDRLWFVNDETPDPTDRDPYPSPVRRVWSVAPSGVGTPTPAGIRGFEGGLTRYGRDLVYVRGDLGGSGRAIVSFDPTSGEEEILQRVGHENIASLVSRATDLYWVSYSRRDGAESSVLVRFSEGRAGDLVTTTSPPTLSFVVGESAVVYQRWSTGGSRARLVVEEMPHAGGDPRLVYRLGDDPRYTWSLIGASATEIFVTLRAALPERSSIRAIPFDGSVQRVVAEVDGFGSEPILDGEDLFWIDGDFGRSILHTKTSGGPVTRIASSPDERRIGGVALDSCNVYWTVVSTERGGTSGIYLTSRARPEPAAR